LPILILCAFARLYVAKIYAFAGSSAELRLACIVDEQGSFGRSCWIYSVDMAAARLMFI
jgi:hypothetical protein